jgi:16S rRNA (cytosine967-C5)-methyltransferase
VASPRRDATRTIAADVARRTAFEVVRRVRRGPTWEEAWERHGRAVASGSLDRRFAVELASGVVRLRARLDFVLQRHCKRPLAELQPDVLDVLRLGAYQLLEMDRVSDWAGVHATVELAKSVCPRATALVNAVLRALLRAAGEIEFPAPERDPKSHLVTAGSHPEWIVGRWLRRFGTDETLRLCAYNNRRPRLSLRVNRQRATSAQVRERLPQALSGRWSADAVRAPEHGWAQVRPLLESGWVSVQDESAVLVTEEASPGPGEVWLDLAAAPGGKACHLAERVGEAGRVLAYDVGSHKVQRIRDNAVRLGLENIVAAEGNALEIEAPSADGVLLDAPCSGLGVLSRRPDARWRKRPGDLERLSELQLRLLESARQRVNPGGVLVYSVCSFEPEETTGVVERLTALHPELALESGQAPEALRYAPGILYFFPQRHDVDGGFVARWRVGSRVR